MFGDYDCVFCHGVSALLFLDSPSLLSSSPLTLSSTTPACFPQALLSNSRQLVTLLPSFPTYNSSPAIHPQLQTARTRSQHGKTTTTDNFSLSSMRGSSTNPFRRIRFGIRDSRTNQYSDYSDVPIISSPRILPTTRSPAAQFETSTPPSATIFNMWQRSGAKAFGA